MMMNMVSFGLMAAACLTLAILPTSAAHPASFVDTSIAMDPLAVTRRNMDHVLRFHQALHPSVGFVYPFQRMELFRPLLENPFGTTRCEDARQHVQQQRGPHDKAALDGVQRAKTPPPSRQIPIQTITRTPGDDSQVRYVSETPPNPRPTPVSGATPSSVESAAHRGPKTLKGQPLEVEVRDVVANEPRSSASLPDIEGCLSAGFCDFSREGTVKFGGDTYACAPAGDGIMGKAPSLSDCAVWYKV